MEFACRFFKARSQLKTRVIFLALLRLLTCIKLKTAGLGSMKSKKSLFSHLTAETTFIAQPRILTGTFRCLVLHLPREMKIMLHFSNPYQNSVPGLKYFKTFQPGSKFSSTFSSWWFTISLLLLKEMPLSLKNKNPHLFAEKIYDKAFFLINLIYRFNVVYSLHISQLREGS